MAVVICLAIQKQGKDLALLLSLGVCVMVLAVAVGFLKPVLDFTEKLATLGKLESSFLQTVLKAAGIAITAEFAEMICADSGNSALGKGVHILAGAVILWLSLPVFTALIELIQKILEVI